MKRLLPIGLLALLLYNMFGLTFAVLFFDTDYLVPTPANEGAALKVVKIHLPSMPYGGDLAITQTPQVLIRESGNFYNPTEVLHKNDTLYITLKSNQAARDHFFELANAIQMLNEPAIENPQDPYSKAIKLLSNLLKNYISRDNTNTFEPAVLVNEPRFQLSVRYKRNYTGYFMQLPSPPPEHC